MEGPFVPENDIKPPPWPPRADLLSREMVKTSSYRTHHGGQCRDTLKGSGGTGRATVHLPISLGCSRCSDLLGARITSIMRNRSEVIANSLTRGTLRAGSNTILPRALLKWVDYVAMRGAGVRDKG